MNDSKLPLADRLGILLEHLTNTQFFADDGPNAQTVRDAIATHRQQHEALVNLADEAHHAINALRAVKHEPTGLVIELSNARAAIAAAEGEQS